MAQAPVLGDVGDQAIGDTHLPFGSTRLPLLVDGQSDDGGTVFLDQTHDLLEPRVGPVAVLVVDRVDGATSAEVLEAGLEHGRFGGVEHDRQRRRSRQSAGECGHVGGTVAADVVDVEVQHVRAVAGLILGDVEALLVVLGEHRVTKCLGAVGVGALTDHQDAGVLLERHGGVERGDAWLRGRLPFQLRRPVHHVGNLTNVLGGGAAASADECQPVLADETAQSVGQFGGGQWVFGTLRAQRRQSGIGHHRYRKTGMLGQVAQVFAHLGGAGGAVQSDHVDAQRFERGEGCTDLAADQHCARRLDRHMGDDRDSDAELVHGVLATDDRGLDLQ
ncbi:unannotated protein [freshwater metagenome]|uniref:Unannotated protein n=1 Tax=freshwater metagenome TaxID=449393 RepID=A0A6J7FMF8_9ZZZZ